LAAAQYENNRLKQENEAMKQEVMQLQMAKMADEWRTEEDTPQQEAQEKSALAKRQKDKLRKTNEELHSQVMQLEMAKSELASKLELALDTSVKRDANAKAATQEVEDRLAAAQYENDRLKQEVLTLKNKAEAVKARSDEMLKTASDKLQQQTLTLEEASFVAHEAQGKAALAKRQNDKLSKTVEELHSQVMQLEMAKSELASELATR